MKTLRERAEEGLNGDFLPKVTYTEVSFSPTSNMKNEDSWGHVTTLLMDIAEKPRKLITDPYARRVLSKGITLKDYFKAMDVVDDCIIQQGAGAEPRRSRN